MKRAILVMLFACWPTCALQAKPRIFPVRNPHAPQFQTATVTTTDGNGIDYHGGPLLLGTPTVYPIWYGNHNATTITIVQQFMRALSGSPYFAINRTYHDGAGNRPSGNFNVASPVYDNYSQGTALTNDIVQIQLIAQAHIGRDLPLDRNGIYMVFTSPDVRVSGGIGSFGANYCGWHDYGVYQGVGLQYSFVGDASVIAPSTCQSQIIGPNGNSGADGMMSVAAHEIEEAVTDPDVATGWYSAQGLENADLCAWQYGATQTAANGARYNLSLAGANYLIQQNWINAGGGYCAMSDTSAFVPKVTITEPVQGQVFQCDSTNRIYVKVVGFGTDYLGRPLSGFPNIYTQADIHYATYNNTGYGSILGFGLSPGATYTFDCLVQYDASQPKGLTYSGGAWVIGMDQVTLAKATASVTFTVRQYVPPVPPPPPPPPPLVCPPGTKPVGKSGKCK